MIECTTEEKKRQEMGQAGARVWGRAEDSGNHFTLEKQKSSVRIKWNNVWCIKHMCTLRLSTS